MTQRALKYTLDAISKEERDEFVKKAEALIEQARQNGGQSEQ